MTPRSASSYRDLRVGAVLEELSRRARNLALISGGLRLPERRWAHTLQLISPQELRVIRVRPGYLSVTKVFFHLARRAKRDNHPAGLRAHGGKCVRHTARADDGFSRMQVHSLFAHLECHFALHWYGFMQHGFDKLSISLVLRHSYLGGSEPWAIGHSFWGEQTAFKSRIEGPCCRLRIAWLSKFASVSENS